MKDFIPQSTCRNVTVANEITDTGEGSEDLDMLTKIKKWTFLAGDLQNMFWNLQVVKRHVRH